MSAVILHLPPRRHRAALRDAALGDVRPAFLQPAQPRCDPDALSDAEFAARVPPARFFGEDARVRRPSRVDHRPSVADAE